MKKTFYITTPIFYPSGELHIGHVYTTTIAWVLRNYKRKQGYETLFLTGMDEHGQKILKKAIEKEVTPQSYVDAMYKKITNLWEAYEIDYDIFSRTTKEKHKEKVQTIFTSLFNNNYIYLDKYMGWYSVEDEEYVAETDAIKNDNKYFHPDSNHELKFISEESYFLKVSQKVDWLKKYYIEHPNFIKPTKIIHELLNNFLNNGLKDLSITRTAFDWGIKPKENKKHTIYVWLDALSNYITMLGYGKENSQFSKFWKNGNEIVHVIGKEITRFHCIYWPMILNMLSLRQPTEIVSHGWIITPTGKMSKSKNNTINPLELLLDFHPEIIKYFLMSKQKLKNDGVFSIELLKNTYNAELVNIYGNLVSRTIGMLQQNFPNDKLRTPHKNTLNFIDVELLKNVEINFQFFEKNMDAFQIDLAIKSIIELCKKANNYIDQTMPWKIKDDSNKLMKILYNLFHVIYAATTMLEIIIPVHSKKIAKILNLSSLSFSMINNYSKLNNQVISQEKFVPIFPRKK